MTFRVIQERLHLLMLLIHSIYHLFSFEFLKEKVIAHRLRKKEEKTYTSSRCLLQKREGGGDKYTKTPSSCHRYKHNISVKDSPT